VYNSTAVRLFVLIITLCRQRKSTLVLSSSRLLDPGAHGAQRRPSHQFPELPAYVSTIAKSYIIER
jgi:hypothetical protein